MACTICGRDCQGGVPQNTGSGITITHITKETPMYTLDRPMAMNADKTKAVDEDSPEAAYVLGGKGSVIPNDLAIQLGLISKDDPIKPEMNPNVEPVEDRNPSAARNLNMALENMHLTSESTTTGPTRGENNAQRGRDEAEAQKAQEATVLGGQNVRSVDGESKPVDEAKAEQVEETKSETKPAANKAVEGPANKK